ncbi:hypothetical protein [Leucobacter massiliensis]|uniref:hypothetical protein n=1 Tax=Leucobacter massiliensis TaxID=1686285 RepID=UPI0015E3FD26|nr:hypothetical protein [Leucobacter massiliensis]
MSSAATVRSLQQRIAEMQPLRLDDRALPTAPGLRPLFPDGALRRGASYAVQGSQQLALALLADASAAGSWCGVIGCPAFGAEAAAELGLALDRCVLIPHPGEDALGIAGALSEVLTVVALHAPAQPRPGEAERISARLREHGSTLVALGSWPRAESTLHVVSSRWHGLGRGRGMLEDRELTVQSRDRLGTREHVVRFAGGTVADGTAASGTIARGSRAASRTTPSRTAPGRTVASISPDPAVAGVHRLVPR